jgi:hypothetical protein
MLSQNVWTVYSVYFVVLQAVHVNVHVISREIWCPYGGETHLGFDVRLSCVVQGFIFYVQYEAQSGIDV